MFKTIKDLFDQITRDLAAPADTPPDPHTLQLATAVLLVEVMRATPELHQDERDTVLRALRRKFELADDELERLIELAHDTARTSNDYHRFTQLLNERFTQPQKIAVVEATATKSHRNFARPLPRVYARETQGSHDQGSSTAPGRRPPMKAREMLSIAVATATLAMSTTAFADDDRRGGRRHHDGPRVEHRHVEKHVHRHNGPRHVERHVYHHGPRVVHRDVHIVHKGPRWSRGHYVPYEYRQSRYVVRHHNPRLYTPPRGHHWIQVNGDFLLVAAATGLIAHAILNH